MNWLIGLLVDWFIGLLVYWMIGLLVIGISVICLVAFNQSVFKYLRQTLVARPTPEGAGQTHEI